MRVKCLHCSRTQHTDPPKAEPVTPDLESCALTIRPPRFHTSDFKRFFFPLIFVYLRTGEIAMGYGEVAEESIRRYYPKRAHFGR